MVMVSHAPSSGERQANGRAGAQGRGNGRVERAHGTPRKEAAVKEKAVQDPGLKDYVSSAGLEARTPLSIV